MRSLRERWATGAETLGLWLSLPGPVGAEIAGRQDVEYVCVDTQHGIIDYQAAVPMIQAIELVGGTPIVRVPWNEPGIIGKVLDAGAHGVIVPMVNTRAQAEAVVSAVRYVPDGTRSWGPMVAAARHPDYRRWAAANVAAIPMVETAEAIANLDEIVSVPGIDAVYVGPADLSISLGAEPSYSEDDATFTDALERVVAACQRYGVVPGIHAHGALAQRRRDQGFRMITVTNDATAVRVGYHDELAVARRSRAAPDASSSDPSTR